MMDAQAIKEIALIEEVVGRYVQLKRNGGNLWGRCPFHSEKSPSFSVSPVKGFYKCFGCGAGGDVYDFVMNIDRLTFPEAVALVASMYGLEYQSLRKKGHDDPERAKKDGVMACLKWCAGWFADRLPGSPGAAHLKERGLTVPDAGWCPESGSVFIQAAADHGYSHEDLIAAGVAGLSNRDGQIYAVFRSRLVFVIRDRHGNPIGFGGRLVSTTAVNAPKYINSPNTVVYDKTKVLYGLDRAARAIMAADEVIVTEGYTDVEAAQMDGVHNVVATCGTSMTDEHLALLHRYASGLVLLMDGDKAGVAAMVKTAGPAVRQGFNVRSVIMPDGHDPESYRRQYGEKAFAEYVQRSKMPVVKALWLMLCADDDSRGSAMKQILEVISMSESEIDRNVMIRDLAKVSSVSELVLYSAMPPVSAAKAAVSVPVASAADQIDGRELAVIGLLMNNAPREVYVPGDGWVCVVDHVMRRLDGVMVRWCAPCQTIWNEYVRQYNAAEPTTPENYTYFLSFDQDVRAIALKVGADASVLDDDALVESMMSTVSALACRDIEAAIDDVMSFSSVTSVPERAADLARLFTLLNRFR